MNKENKENIISTELGDIFVPGWAAMLRQNKNRALTLRAMINLEIKQYLYGHAAPTQLAILEESIRIGADLSPTSQKSTSGHIKHLIDDEHVVYRTAYKSPERGRGGPTSPWMTRYVSSMLANFLRGRQPE